MQKTVSGIAEKGKCGFNCLLFTLMSAWTRNREVCLSYFVNCLKEQAGCLCPLSRAATRCKATERRGSAESQETWPQCLVSHNLDLAPGKSSILGAWHVQLSRSAPDMSQHLCCWWGAVDESSVVLQLLSAAALCLTPCIMWPVVLKWKISFCKVQWLKSHRAASQRSMKLNISLPLNRQIF